MGSSLDFKQAAVMDISDLDSSAKLVWVYFMIFFLRHEFASSISSPPTVLHGK
ncbi:MAG: hypothetical protein ABSE48_05435 [Verrucomicrobiota bacterium]|jgi:hypothetical protein